MMCYQISFDDKIMATSVDWDAAALAQSGQGALTRNILGASIWSVIRDDETRRYLNALFFICRRSQTSLTVPYRCDTPHEPRLFDMTIEALADGALRISHEQQPGLSVAQDVISPMAIKARPDQCSQCLRIDVKGVWVEAFFLQQVGLSYQHWTVCPDCRAAVTKLAIGFAAETAQWDDHGGPAHAQAKGLQAGVGACNGAHPPEMAE